MTVGDLTLRNLVSEYFDNYNINDKFSYNFGKGQFIICESIDEKGISKNAIIALLNEFLSDYTLKDKFLYDMHNCSFLAAVQTARITRKIHEEQKTLTEPMTRKEFFDSDKSKSRHVFAEGFGENTIQC